MSAGPAFTVAVDPTRCEGAAACLKVCPTRVFRLDRPQKGLPLVVRLKVAVHGGRQAVAYDEGACIGCIACVTACPEHAIAVTPTEPTSETALPKGHETMKAIQIDSFDGAPLRLTDVPAPIRQPGFAVVRMLAAGVNPIDDGVRRGYAARFPGALSPPIILGHEGVGVVVEAAETGPPPGTRVLIFGGYGVSMNGTWADRVLARPDDLFPLGNVLSDAEAGGFPLVGFTAYFALTLAGRLQPGQSVLVPAVGGGVGNAGVQIATALGAAKVITTAGSSEKAVQARALGFENVIDLSSESLVTAVHAMTDGNGVDVVLDSIGGNILADALHVLKIGGTIVSVGSSGGAEASLDLVALRHRLANVIGFNPMAQMRQPEVMRRAADQLIGFLNSGHVRPMVARTFALGDAEDAIKFLRSARPFGKVVLEISGQ